MSKFSSFIISCMLIIFMGNTSSFAGIITPDLRSAMKAAGPGKEISVIVTFSDIADLSVFKDKNKKVKRSKIIKALKAKSASSQKELKTFLKNKDVKDITPLWIINGLSLQAGPDLILKIADRPGVDIVKLDSTISAPEVTAGLTAVSEVAASSEGNINTIRATELWTLGYTGSGTVVAIMDTGVDLNHPDLTGKWRGGTNSWFDPNDEHNTPYDRTGHGTQVMGIMVGGDAGGTAIGVAPGAQWIAVKIFNDAGDASLSAIHQGYQWILDPDGDLNTNDAPDVVNNSWGFEQDPNKCYLEFQPDVQALRASEIEVTFSGGNTGPYSSSSVSPANYPESFAVGSINDLLTISNFSGRGPSACEGDIYPELVAPGENIRTTDLTLGFPDSYTIVTGTSFAVPHVSGTMSLLIDAFPCATVNDLESALINSGQDISGHGQDNDYGYGLIDSIEAYNVLSNSGIPAGTDADDDGYFIEGEHCGAIDCNDSDPLINPGAAEITHDSIDQDCNGYDLTIDIIKADYSVSRNNLSVEATSSLGKNAGLQLSGYGPMKWNRKKAKWAITAATAGGDPGTITVSGIEGSESIQTTSDGGSGGSDTGSPEGKGKTCSDGLDNDKDNLIDCGDPDCSRNKNCK